MALRMKAMNGVPHVLVLSTLFSVAFGHGQVTHPKPRQAVDGQLAPWNGTVPPYPVGLVHYSVQCSGLNTV